MHSRIQNIAAFAAFVQAQPQQLALSVQNAFLPGNPTGQNGAMGFDVNIYEQVVAASREVKLPEILWSQTLPAGSLDTSVNVGAKLVSYRVKDRRGKGAFRAAIGKDIPTVGSTINKVTIPMEAGAVGASIDLEDFRAVAFGHEGLNIITENGATMREASERHIEHTFFYGFATLGFAGYLDYSLSPLTTASVKAATGTAWANATPDEIINDVVTGITTIGVNSKGIFKAGRLELPIAQFMLIAGRRINGTAGNGVNETILSFLKRNNPYTAQTGIELDIRQLRYLQGAGVGATDRAIFSDANPDNQYMPMSEAFNMLAPQDVQLSTNLFGTYKFGSYHRPLPTAFLNMDGI